MTLDLSCDTKSMSNKRKIGKLVFVETELLDIRRHDDDSEKRSRTGWEKLFSTTYLMKAYLIDHLLESGSVAALVRRTH